MFTHACVYVRKPQAAERAIVKLRAVQDQRQPPLAMEGASATLEISYRAARFTQREDFHSTNCSTLLPCSHIFSAFTVLRSELTFRPFLLACAAKSTKLTIISLNALQKLLALDAASAEILSSVIGTLRIQAECDDESIQVKILQTLLLAVGSAPAMARMEENALSQVCARAPGVTE